MWAHVPPLVRPNGWAAEPTLLANGIIIKITTHSMDEILRFEEELKLHLTLKRLRSCIVERTFVNQLGMLYLSIQIVFFSN